MNIGLIFAGGVGSRMKMCNLPKQFIRIYKKPIIIYTLEHFEAHSDIDAIIIVCVSSYIEYLKELLKEFKISKVHSVVAGGETAQASIYQGLLVAEQHFPKDTITLIHDGVRPVINAELISANIRCAKINGNAVSACRAQETVAFVSNSENKIDSIMNRSNCYILKAPQTFILENIIFAHRYACAQDNIEFIDSASMMQHYGSKIYYIETEYSNIKVTTQFDLNVCKSVFVSNKFQPN